MQLQHFMETANTKLTNGINHNILVIKSDICTSKTIYLCNSRLALLLNPRWLAILTYLEYMRLGDSLLPRRLCWVPETKISCVTFHRTQSWIFTSVAIYWSQKNFANEEFTQSTAKSLRKTLCLSPLSNLPMP